MEKRETFCHYFSVKSLYRVIAAGVLSSQRDWLIWDFISSTTFSPL